MKDNMPIVRIPPASLTVEGFSQADVELLKTTYFKDLNDTEIRLALKQAQSMGLNPFNREIYAIKIGSRLSIVTGIAGFRKNANKFGNYLGCKVTVQLDNAGKIFSATAVVKKAVANHIAEFEATVLFDEYDQKREKWLTMPEAMIRKTAEINALKMAFPNMEAVSEESYVEPVVESVDVMPEYENETQEPPPMPPSQGPVQKIAEQKLGDPGDFIIPSGSNEGKMIKDVPPTELQEFIKWAHLQKRLAPRVRSYLQNAEAFLETVKT